MLHHRLISRPIGDPVEFVPDVVFTYPVLVGELLDHGRLEAEVVVHLLHRKDVSVAMPAQLKARLLELHLGDIGQIRLLTLRKVVFLVFWLLAVANHNNNYLLCSSPCNKHIRVKTDSEYRKNALLIF